MAPLLVCAVVREKRTTYWRKKLDLCLECGRMVRAHAQHPRETQSRHARALTRALFRKSKNSGIRNSRR